YVGLASFTVLVYDHCITFSDEFEYIWKRPRGLRESVCFYNRYLTPLGFVVNTVAYHRTNWTLQVSPISCKHFVRYEGSMAMIGITVVAWMMFLRIRVLYNGVWIVQAFVLAILFTFIGVNTWFMMNGLLSHSHNANFSPRLACTMIIDPKIGPIASSTAWLPLLYDTVVMSLTLKRTVMYLAAESGNPGHIFRVLLHEGLLYYSVICAVTLTFTLMIIFADQSVRNITGQCVTHTSPVLTVVMMSRITLHLKAHRDRYEGVVYSNAMQNYSSPRRFPRPGASIMVFAPTRRNARVKSPPHAASPRGRHNFTSMALGDESFMTDVFSMTMTTTTEGEAAVRTWQPPELEGPVMDGAVLQRPTDEDEIHESGVVSDVEEPKDKSGCVV
ncbi:hypothetical protein BGW80DRAFT_1177689, partial [Lactifluus volemus]